MNAVKTKMINADAFTLTAAKFTKYKIEKSALKNAKMEEVFKKMAEAVDEKTNKIKLGLRRK